MQEYTLNGPAGEYTTLLSDEDAKRLNATPVEAKKPAAKAARPANKSASAQNKADG